MNLQRTFLGFCSSFVLLLNTTIIGQTGLTNARSFGMCGAYTALAAGVDAGRWNPANLGLRRAPKLSLHFASFGAGAHNNAFTKSDYDLYNGAYLNARQKAGILSRIPAEGWRFNLAGEMDLVGVSLQNYAVTFGLDFASNAKLSRDFVDLILNGNRLDQTYDFSNSTGAGAAILTLGFSYGRSLRLNLLTPYVQEFAIGGTIKYLRGLSIGEVTEASGSMTTRFDGIFGNGHAIVRQASGGNGIALDLGAAAVVNKKFSLGLSLRNFPGFINWSTNAQENEYGVIADSLTAEQWASSHEDSVIQHDSEERVIAGFSQRLPMVVHVGAAYDQGQVLLSGEIVQGLDNRLNAATTPELRFGVEGRLFKFILPRAGLSLGGKRGASSAFGVGFTTGTFHADFAAGTWSGLLPAQGKGIGVAFGMRLELGPNAKTPPKKPLPTKRGKISR